MNGFKLTDHVKPSLVLIAVIIAGIFAIPSFRSMAEPQRPQQEISATDIDKEEIELAELRLSILSQQIVVARIEREMLDPAQRAAEQKVAAREADLAAATVQSENASRLYKDHIVAEPEVQLQAAKRDAAAAELMIAEAERDAAAESIKLKEANIMLLRLKEKMAKTELNQMRQ